MNSGKLRFKLVLKNPVYSTPATLNQEPSYEFVDFLSANVEDLGERERSYAFQQGAVVTHRITTRWSEITAQITTKSRLYLNAREFHVTFVSNIDSRNRELQIDVAEKM